MGVLFTEGGLVKQDHRHRKVGPNIADAEHGVCQELDLVVIHVLPCVGFPGREISHVQDDAVAIFPDSSAVASAPPPASLVSSPALGLAGAGAGAAAARMALPGESLSSLMDASSSLAAAPAARTGGSATAAPPELPVAHSMSDPNKMAISSMSSVMKFCNDASDCGAYSDLVNSRWRSK
jgi:hypothetical protein